MFRIEISRKILVAGDGGKEETWKPREFDENALRKKNKLNPNFGKHRDDVTPHQNLGDGSNERSFDPVP